MLAVDCHQHVWPEALVDALARRSSGPRVVVEDGRPAVLQDGERPTPIDPTIHDLGTRAAVDRADGVDLTLLSFSSPLGIETLPPEEAAPLVDAWNGTAVHLPSSHRLWAGVGLVEPDLPALAAVLASPSVVGLQVPATTLADPQALERLAPVLAVAQDAGRPVLVHPGAVPAHADAAHRPPWWPALTSYPAQLASAWFTWLVAGRSLLPTLRVAFVALAGLAPLHHERLAQRGGDLGAIDPHVYYETSSYGPRAVDHVVRVVGVDPLVHGSDRPWALPTDPGLGEAFARSLRHTNPHHLMNERHLIP